MNSSHRIVEIWTRADVASRLGKWSVAEELWTKIREFYSCHGEIPGSREFVEECDVQINRAQKYGSLSAQRHDRSNAKKKRKRVLVEPKPSKARIEDSAVDNIMMAFDAVSNVHEEIQNSDTISPPPLQESFYIVPSQKNTHKVNAYEKLMIKNRELRRLKQMNSLTFSRLKQAMEDLAQEHAYLFPEKLTSRYSLIIEENKELKSRLLKNKNDEQTSV